VVSASASVLVGPRVRLSAGSYQDLINWYCSLLTGRTVCGRAAGNTPRTQKQTEWIRMNAEVVQTQSWRYRTIVVVKRQQQTTISYPSGWFKKSSGTK